MEAVDHDPFAPSTSTAQSSGSGSGSGHSGATRALTASDIGAQTAGARQLTNLEKAMVVTSPVIERANPLGMHVVSKQRRKSKTGASTSSHEASTCTTSIASNGKGKAAANGEQIASESSDSDEAALEPREAIRQQFQVNRRILLMSMVQMTYPVICFT